MSPREKKLLIFFAAAGFIVVNFLAFAWYQQISQRKRGERMDATVAVERAEMLMASRDLVNEQMEWLAEHEPSPIAYQDAQTALQQFVEQQTRSAGLTIRNERPLPVDDSGVHYHRARIQIEVTGGEEALYRWLYAIKSPENFRVATRILLNPNREDDTRIDCRADVEQWFVPTAPDV